MKGIQTSTQDRVIWARCHSTEIAVCGIEVVICVCRDFTSSTFLRPFAPRELPRFTATTDALTPARPALRLPLTRRLWQHEHRPDCRAGLPASTHQIFRPFHLQPPLVVPGADLVLRYGTYRRETASRSPHPLGRVSHDVTWASPFPSRLATTTGRIEFVILRTGRSLPVALHLLSRERSYLQLQGSGQTPTRTSTSQIRCACRRTRMGTVPTVLTADLNSHEFSYEFFDNLVSYTTTITKE